MNTQRNEVEITLGEKKYTLRATFNAIAEIEDYFNMPMIEIVTRKLDSGSVRATEIKAIIMAGLRGYGVKVSEDEIEQAIMEAGLIGSLNQVVPFLVQAFKGSPEVKK